ncbi:MAG TPA: rRNA maturation RNase YbeY [Gemmatimonadales bacterium]
MGRHEVRVAAVGVSRPVSPALARRAVGVVLDGERAARASVHIVFLSSQRMRVLNRRTFGRDRSTDVIAFTLRHDDRLVGDIYVCPAAVRRGAAHHGRPVREEFVRVMIHGTLHLLGHDHPESHRTRSRMWRLQEQYVTAVGGVP